jgi:hypothetical protein
MPTPAAYDPDSILNSVIEHVFMPPKLPQEAPDGDIEQKVNVALCDNLIEATQVFIQNVSPSHFPLWSRMIKTMQLARRSATASFKEADLRQAFSEMVIGGTSIQFALLSAFGSMISYQTYLLCMSVHRMLL